jgi:arylsulfatase A-like enzyme
MLPPHHTVQARKLALLIVVDTLRSDRLSCYGFQQHMTPGIDALAESAVLFSNARATAGWTDPSMD